MDQQVREFHIKHKYSQGMSIKEVVDSQDTMELQYLADKLEVQLRTIKQTAIAAQEQRGDPRMYRAWLMLEELHEAITAMVNQDEIELADALGDLDYVTHGTAVTFDIPLDEIALEVHRSNMTKKVRNKKDDPRLRDKGDDYQAPDIVGVIRGYQDMKGCQNV